MIPKRFTIALILGWAVIGLFGQSMGSSKSPQLIPVSENLAVRLFSARGEAHFKLERTQTYFLDRVIMPHPGSRIFLDLNGSTLRLDPHLTGAICNSPSCTRRPSASGYSGALELKNGTIDGSGRPLHDGALYLVGLEEVRLEGLTLKNIIDAPCNDSKTGSPNRDPYAEAHKGPCNEPLIKLFNCRRILVQNCFFLDNETNGVVEHLWIGHESLKGQSMDIQILNNRIDGIGFGLSVLGLANGATHHHGTAEVLVAGNTFNGRCGQQAGIQRPNPLAQFSRRGIKVAGVNAPPGKCRIERNALSEYMIGIKVENSSGVRIIGNRCARINLNGPDTPTTGVGEGISLSTQHLDWPPTVGAIIEGNSIEDVTGLGIGAKRHSRGALIQNNTILRVSRSGIWAEPFNPQTELERPTAHIVVGNTILGFGSEKPAWTSTFHLKSYPGIYLGSSAICRDNNIGDGGLLQEEGRTSAKNAIGIETHYGAKSTLSGNKSTKGEKLFAAEGWVPPH